MDSIPTTGQPEIPRRKRSAAHKVFLFVLLLATISYGSILAFHLLTPRSPVSEAGSENLSVLERCRELCLAYGLVPTGHLANDAKAYLKSENVRPLDAPMYQILSDAQFRPQETQQHPLLGKQAPGFALKDDRTSLVSLNETLKDVPVVIVFYYGYHCNHCVSQLFSIHEDLQRFAELGTKVVAISADPPELTAKRFAEYGRFDFPVLADPDNSVAQAYGVYQPEAEGRAEVKMHGTFIIDVDGKVLWCNTGHSPFLDNQTLLTVIARQHGLIPAKSRTTAD